jgi:hypothetical protein
MQLVEQHIIGKSDSRYEVIDAAAFASKNLYPPTDNASRNRISAADGSSEASIGRAISGTSMPISTARITFCAKYPQTPLAMG